MRGNQYPSFYSIYGYYAAATVTPFKTFAVPDVVPDAKNVAASSNAVSTTYGSVRRPLPSSFLPSESLEAALPDS